MRLVERKQTAEYEKAANSHPQVTPNVRTGRGDHVGQDDEEEVKSTASYFGGKTVRRRQKQAMGKVVNVEMKGIEDSEDDENVAFLKKYCT